MKLLLILVASLVCVSSNLNHLFSASFYKRFSRTKDGNFLLSPFSAENNLALIQSASFGETAQEIRTTLNIYNTELFSRNLFTAIEADVKCPLQIANKMYVNNNFPIKHSFRRTAHETYKSDVENINFENVAEAARTINNWVEQQTENKIRNLIDSSNLDSETKIVLLNALYFKANWTNPFLIAYTKKLNFHLSEYETVKANMMPLEKTLNYYESKDLDAQFLELPFDEMDASMVIVLPNRIDGLKILESRIRKIFKNLNFSKHLVKLHLPKFRIETSANLEPILEKMGIKRIFDQDQADLSGISGLKHELFVDQIMQKNFIDVSEEGVEAAAATYTLIAVPLSGPLFEPKTFLVNRPFLFYIKIKNFIVFVGRVVNPVI